MHPDTLDLTSCSGAHCSGGKLDAGTRIAKRSNVQVPWQYCNISRLNPQNAISPSPLHAVRNYSPRKMLVCGHNLPSDLSVSWPSVLRMAPNKLMEEVAFPSLCGAQRLKVQRPVTSLHSTSKKPNCTAHRRMRRTCLPACLSRNPIRSRVGRENS